jgi:signal transduction histidine kinase
MLRDALMFALGFGLVAATGHGTGRRSPRSVLLTDSEDLRDRFLATISHELRTPLNAIIGWAQVLKTGRLGPAEVTRAIDAIDRNARVEARLVTDLLDVSRMRQGRQAIARSEVDLGQLTNRVVASARPAADAKGVRLRRLGRQHRITIEGDETRLEEAVRHLIANSVKFTLAGGCVNVRVSREGAFAVLRVEDDGLGIATEDLPHVAEPFYQATPQSIRSGLGLGLTLVNEIAELHGGTVQINSPGPGAGTRVILRLPIGCPAAVPPRITLRWRPR